MHAGVLRVSASPRTGMVVVHGDVDATTLRWLLQRTMRRRVAVVSDGGRPSPHFDEGIRYMAPTQYAPPPPPYAWASSPYAATAYPYHWSAPPPPPQHYYPYDGHYQYGAASSTGDSCSIM